LVSALMLAKNGIMVRIIDKNGCFHVGSRGFGIQPRIFELFEVLGINDELQKLATPIPTMRAYKLPGGTIPVKTWDLYERGDVWPDRPYVRGACLGQDLLEGVLREHLAKYGVTVEVGKGVTALHQSDDSVIASITTFYGDLLIGSDGARVGSTRKLLNLTFEGETQDADGMVWGDVQIKGLTSDYWHIWGKPGEFTPEGDKFGIGITGLNFDPTELGDPAKAVEFIRNRSSVWRMDVALIFQVCEFIAVTVLSLCSSLHRPNMRMVNKFQEGRAFVVGDSAHVHPPRGGQGMNCIYRTRGFNLACKLAWVGKRGNPSLLATYHGERLPVITQMLRATTKLYTHTSASESGWLKWCHSALEMYGINYRFSSIVLDERDIRPKDTEDMLAHAYSGYEGRGSLCAGDRAPDAPRLTTNNGETTLYKLLKPDAHTILVFGDADISQLSAVGSTNSRVFVVRSPGEDASLNEFEELVDGDDWAHRAYLAKPNDRLVVVIRPDTYIGALFTEGKGVTGYLARLGS
ncbi:FAD/NAD(P)-binding domain-containing protein, partial [Pleurotus eryngii]